MRSIFAMGLLAMLLISGCGYKEGVATRQQASYLYFSGDTQGTEVTVDGGERFTVKSGRDNQYQVAPGVHTVRVYRDNVLIVERQVYIGNGVAKEIGVN